MGPSRRPLTKAQAEELERIRSKHRGILKPEWIVRDAEDEDNPLHSRFCWDDTEAARRYRLMEAQEVIRVAVVVLQGKGGEDVIVRAYTSLDEDRASRVGYRATVSVLDDKQLRRQMLDGALRDIAILEAKHKHLDELAEVWAAAEKVRRRKR